MNDPCLQVFLKYWHVEQLNELLDRQLGRVEVCQRVARGYVARRRVRWLHKVAQQRVTDMKAVCNQLAQHGDQAYYAVCKQQEHDRLRHLEQVRGGLRHLEQVRGLRHLEQVRGLRHLEQVRGLRHLEQVRGLRSTTY